MSGAVPARGHRGYIASRPLPDGHRVPQHVQNLVVRDHAARRGLLYKLSATEYVMPHCHMMLDQVLEELPRLDGIILYSMFLLPSDAERRRGVYDRVLGLGATLHAAVEDLVLIDGDDVDRWEDIFRIAALTGGVLPAGGRRVG